MLLRYSIYNSLYLFILAYACVFYNAVGYLWASDPTRFSFGFIALYLMLTAYMGYKQEKANLKMVRFFANRFTSIAIVGTVIGIKLLLNTVGSSNITELTDIVKTLFSDFSTVLITTLFGIAHTVILEFQVAYVYGDWDSPN